ncbi:34K [Simian adenovirus 19]|uniref:34K n=1 Tax=Simian adenovirus 19 TaxID=38416 RepID=A0A0M3TH37_9ADEN|nr:34K [Simian adenovirus 19]ALE30450.1 34K [Simian adenovirus 19]
MQRDRRYRCRLGPYNRHQLPPCNDTPCATIENPPYLECENLNMHNVSEVRGVPSCVSFTVLQEWPVYWDSVLTAWEKHVMKTYMQICICCATIDVEYNQIIRGYERWVLHCHCNSPGSLQCKAGGVVLSNWFRMAIYGSLVNVRFPWYRQVVNYHLPKEVLYVGSVFIRGRHLIYVRVFLDGHAVAVLENSSFGWSAFSYGILNNLIIMVCTHCKDLSEIQMRCCAKRTRRFIIRAVRLLDRLTSYQPRRSRLETARQSLLRGLMERHRPFTLAEYGRGENPWRA